MAARVRTSPFSPGTARLRLALLYSGMFLLLGTLVVVIIFVLTSTGSTIQGSSVAAARPVRVTRGYVVPGLVVKQHAADLGRLLTVSWLVLLVTALASAVLGWFAAGRVLRPLRQMTDAARTISAGNLSRRLALVGPDDEFRRLGDTLDDLLARLQAAFEAQRRFVANASHELRTPLTVDRTLLQVALADPHASAEKLRATCEELLASGREQERLLEALLTLASSERGLQAGQPLDLAVAAERAVRVLDGRPVQLSSSMAPALVAGDPALIERLIANLLENAADHNDERGEVAIATGTDDAGAFMVLANTGPVIPAAELPRLFEPFQRLRDGRAQPADGHHGLGLSIVRAIATAHGAAVEARPREGGGLVVRLSFAAHPEVAAARTRTSPG